jgi:hypothetical protein
VTSCISDLGHLWPGLNHKILDVALLRLRFCSIGAAKSDPVNRRQYADKSERLLGTRISFQAVMKKT